MIFIILLGIYSCASMTDSAHAQILNDDRWTTHLRLQQYAQNKFKYQKWLISAKEYYNKRTGQFPIHTLLEAYVGGEYYDPFAQDTIDTLYKYAYLADTEKDPDKADKAAKNFQSLLKWHLPNYTILKSAIPLVYTNPTLGDLGFLKWMFQNITKYILKSGTGQSIYYAYPIHSIDEENLIFNTMKVDVINTEIINNGREYYHIHLTEDRQSGKPGKIYTNMTPIMNHIVTIKKAKNPDYTFPLNVPENFE